MTIPRISHAVTNNQSSITIRILHVEDNRIDARLLFEMINEEYPGQFERTHVCNMKDALNALDTNIFDVVLLDLSLPDSSGLDTVNKIKAKSPGLAIVVLSGADDDKLALQAMQHGAQDYLVKGQGDGILIMRSIRYALERKKITDTLTESELRFRSITQSANDAIIAANEEGNIISWNHGAEQIFQYLEHEALGKPLSIIIPNEYREAHHQGIKHVLASGDISPKRKQVVELYGLRKNGAQFPVEISISSWMVTEADSGESALTLLTNNNHFDIIFMDISMSGIGGEKCTQLIKRNPDWSTIPIIALTAHALAEDKARFLAQGISGYISKPIQLDMLWTEISTALNLNKPEPSQPESTAYLAQESLDQVIDYPQLLQKMNGDKTMTEQLITLLIKNTDKWNADLETAIAGSDEKMIQKLAHSINGTAGSVCAFNLQNAAIELTRLAKAETENMSKMQAKLQNLKTALVQVRNWVKL